jgi:hypothetical protein
MENSKNRLTFSLWLTGLFSIALAFLVAHHELWRDEMQAWLIARDSPSLKILLWQMRYEGTPPLWHLTLHALTQLSQNPALMQGLTWGLSCGMIFLISFFAPFQRLHKVLLALNYYVLYQYGTLCRNYLISLLCLTGACILFSSMKKRPYWMAALLFLASFSCAHGWILAVALGVAYWTHHRHMPSLLIFLAGLCLSVFQMIPAPDTLFPSAVGWHIGWDPQRLSHVASALAHSYLILPNPHSSWETLWWDQMTLYRTLAPLIAIGLGISAIRFLSDHRQALMVYLIGTLGLSVFFYSKYIGYSRHIGFLFFCFLYAFWLKKKSSQSNETHPRVPEVFLTVLLTIQAAGGLLAARQDVQKPFSLGKAVAGEIQARHLQNAFIAVGPDYLGAPLAGYLRRSLYYPQGRRWGSYTKWDYQRIEILTDAEFLARAESEANKQPMVTILDHPLEKTLINQHGLAPLGDFQGALVGDENYFIYMRRPS